MLGNFTDVRNVAISRVLPQSNLMMENVDSFVPVAIGILAAVFVGALVVLVLLCRKHKGDRGHLNKSDVHLIETTRPDLELGEVCLHPDIEQILADEQWIDDATGLVPHGLAVLKACHMVMERLAALAMGPLKTSKTGHEIIEVARRISPRVDDVVRSMYPPLDARLLEARTAALAVSVKYLALVTQYGCNGSHFSRRFHWIDDALGEIDRHLLVLREAALAQEATYRIQNAIVTNSVA